MCFITFMDSSKANLVLGNFDKKLGLARPPTPLIGTKSQVYPKKLLDGSPNYPKLCFLVGHIASTVHSFENYFCLFLPCVYDQTASVISPGSDRQHIRPCRVPILILDCPAGAHCQALSVRNLLCKEVTDCSLAFSANDVFSRIAFPNGKTEIRMAKKCWIQNLA